MSFGQTALKNIEAVESNAVINVCTSDRNNNEKAYSRSSSVDLPLLSSPTSSDCPQIILSRGPEYLRSLIFKRQSAFERPIGRRSAAELLQQSKPHFALLDVNADAVMSLGANPVNSKVNVLEDMSSESNLVESMVTKLCIPKTEASEVGTISQSTAHGADHPTALRTAMVGKRRMCTRADDAYGGQKQRQRLGSAEVDGAGESVADDYGFPGGNVKNDLPFPTTTPSSGFGPVQLNPGNWLNADFAVEKPCSLSQTNGNNRCGKWMEKSDLASQSKEFDGSTSCPHGHGIECMDVESRQPNAESEVKHHCDGAMCSGVEKSAETFRPNGEELEFRATFTASHPGAGEWRELKGECIPGNDRVEEVKGVRMFRKYKKIAGKSGSRSELINRHSNSSEQANISVRNSADLDAFFTEMGMDRNAIASALTEGHLDHTLSTTSLNVFENISSIGTPLDSRSCTSRDSQPTDDVMGKSLDLDDHLGLGMSIVERNARVIRWLCNIRKASTVTDDGEV